MLPLIMNAQNRGAAKMLRPSFKIQRRNGPGVLLQQLSGHPLLQSLVGKVISVLCLCKSHCKSRSGDVVK